jgi:UDP-N-acetylmuramyl pentapeptide synthase
MDATLAIPGLHNVRNALAAAACAHAAGVSLASIGEGLSAFRPYTGRLQVKQTPNGITVIDDSYNASPAAVMAALAVLRDVRARRIAVIGDMLELGTLSADAHEEVGREAARSSDVLIGVGPLARTAVAAAKGAGLREAHTVADGAEALVLLKRLQRPGDVILVKGSHSLALDRLADALVRPVAV